MNYTNSQGQLTAAQEQITLLPTGGAAAVQGRHQVYFPANIYNGVLEVVTPDGRHLKSRPLGVSYDDGSNSVFIAVLTNSIGQLVDSNQVVYPGAFTGFKADLLCTYRRGGFECDLVFRQQPPTPDKYGLDGAGSTLQLVTEFFNTQDPEQIPEQTNNRFGLQDTTLVFGSLTMTRGKAFAMQSSNSQHPVSNSKTPVYKSWVHLQGRTFLIESVPLIDIANDLDALPLTASIQKSGGSNLMLATGHGNFPPAHGFVADTNQILIASADLSQQPGVVLDYREIDSDQTGFTFQGDMTYYISGSVYLNGVTTFEGGTVLKYAPGVDLSIGTSGQLHWLARPYHPVVFTAVDDDTVGDTIDGSTGIPSGYYADIALYYRSYLKVALSNVRVSYAWTGLWLGGLSSSGTTVSDAQFVNCYDPLQDGSSAYISLLKNVLFENVNDLCVLADGYNYAFQNCTFDNVNWIGDFGYSSCYFTNCVLVNVTNTLTSGSLRGDYNGFYNSPVLSSVNSFTSTGYPLQTVGAGNAYLDPSSGFQGVGSFNIDPGLLIELQTKTTAPPTVYSNVIFTTDTTFSQVVARDNTAGTMDLGYHYDAIDYLCGDVYVTNATLTISPGVVVAGFDVGQGYSLGLDGGAQLSSLGLPYSLNRIVEYATVEEGPPNADWSAGLYMPYALVYDKVQNNGSGAAINCQFTDMSCLARDNFLCYLWNQGTVANLRDCQFHGGWLEGIRQTTLNLTNCLLERAYLYAYPNTNNVYIFRNLTMFGGVSGFNVFFNGQSSNMVVKDSLFDQCGGPRGYYGYFPNIGYNAYVTNASYPALNPLHAGDVILNQSPAYQTGALGFYYLPTNSILIDHGSRTAVDANLDAYTVLTNQATDSGMVDIGYHYSVLSPPTAYNYTGEQMCQNGQRDFYLGASDPYGLPLTYIIVTLPAHGTLYNLGSGHFIYTPNYGFTGTDSFTFKVNDGFLDSAAATATITVGDANISANTQTAMTGTDQPLNLTLTASDSSDFCVASSFNYTITANPTNGTLTSTGANRIYTPNLNYEGMDSFTFAASDGVWSNSAAVTIYVVAGPTNLTAQCRFDQVVLNWGLDNAIQGMETLGLDIQNFNVYRSTTHGGPYTLIDMTADANATNYVDMTAAPATTYYYVVTFQYLDPYTGTNYESPYSKEASASPCSLPSPIRPGFNQNVLAANDDNETVTNLLATLPFAINFYSAGYTNLYVNNNGLVTFAVDVGNYHPGTLSVSAVSYGDIIAPFWADVDTKNPLSGLVSYGTNSVSGRIAFGANWISVGYFNSQADKLNTFQIVMINRSDISSGDFDMEFNYAQIEWEAGSASGGVNGFWVGPTLGPPRVGWASASNPVNTFEFNGSGVVGALLDSNPTTGLIHADFNSTLPGRYVFQFRNGIPVGHP